MKALACAAALVCAAASAQDDEEDDWTGKGELGYVQLSGNTESETLNVAVEFKKEGERWTHSSKLTAVNSRNNDVTNAESYSAGWRSEYSVSERAFAFGDFRYFDDRFDSFEAVYTTAVGMGYKMVDEETVSWELSAGVGYRDTEVELTGEDMSSVTYLFESDYSHQLTATTSLENYTRVEVADDNTFGQNKAGLSVAINSRLALKLGHEVRYNSDPEPGFASTDRIVSVNIVYSF